MSEMSETDARTVTTACPLDCPDACSLEVEVVDGRVARIEGSRRNPLTSGFICNKVRRFADHVYAPERLLYPALRRGARGEGKFEWISWDAALDLVAEKMREARARHGGESILPLSYGGSNGLLTQDTTDARLFYRLGASKLSRAVCAAPSAAAARGLYGRMPGVALTDYVEARLIVVWGNNPSASGIHLVPIVQEAQRRGARLVVVDPRRIPLAKRADLHLAPRPGTDLPLALSVLRWLFENGAADWEFLNNFSHGAEELRRRVAPWTLERAAAVTGVAAADIEGFARLYAESSPAVIRAGWGMERNRNGGSAVAAVLALPAVAGKFRVRGGGYTMSNSGIWDLDREGVAAEAPPATRTINMNVVGRALLEAQPPIDVLFVYNCNPLMTMPNQEAVRRGLLREDLFTVVYDQVMTDTARLADLVLPATTFLEHEEMAKGYGAMLLYRSGPAIPPVGEARPNGEVFLELCRRLGLDRPGDPETNDELAAAVLGRLPRVRSELAQGGMAQPESGPYPISFVDTFPRTCDWKVHLVPESLDREAAPHGLYHYQEDPATQAFPLALISPATNRTISSTLGELRRDPVALELHPEDARRRGIEDGARVRVWNELGEVHCLARLSQDLKPGVVFLPKGLWSHNTFSGTTSNALSPDTLADLGEGACFNDARVEVERLS
ncbi:MAG TPA: molybdopterin-dependent oxidoreductase [Thermoanaerobaculia bacterium]|nr:molybdopterin-dependent oxidoreductase [Thermoanaerobaculia bacterium]